MTNNKNPLHPSALRINDVHPGVQFAMFNIARGIIEQGTFTSKPYVGSLFDDGKQRDLLVMYRSEHGYNSKYHLIDLGIVTNGAGHWNRHNFTIPLKKLHLLPSVDEELARRDIEELEFLFSGDHSWDDYYEDNFC